MDDENIPDEEIAAAVVVGASVIEHWSTVFGVVVWSGLTDGIVRFYGYGYDCYPMMGRPASFFKFQTGGLETYLDGWPVFHGPPSHIFFNPPSSP